VNDAPSFALDGDQSAPQDAGPQSVAGFATAISAGPANESGQALTFLVTTDNDALFSELPAIDAATGVLTYASATSAYGTANVTVRLMDDGGTASGGVDTSIAQSFAITVFSPTEQAGNLIDEVRMLLDAGVLNQGQAHALSTRLVHFQTKLADGQTQAALNLLNAFDDQVQALVQGGTLSAEQGQSLLDAADNLRMSLETTADEQTFDRAITDFGMNRPFNWF
jgi:hypothetical protein